MDTEPQFHSRAQARVAASAVERRQTKRADLCVTVGFLSDTNFFTGFTEDISEGGLFVATHMLEPIGTEITLTFALPDGHEITVQGVVCWQRDPHEHTPDAPPGMGVRFLDIAERDLTLIRSFVSLREPLFYDA